MWDLVLMALGVVILADVSVIVILFDSQYKELSDPDKWRVHGIMAPLSLAGFGLTLFGFGALVGWW